MAQQLRVLKRRHGFLPELGDPTPRLREHLHSGPPAFTPAHKRALKKNSNYSVCHEGVFIKPLKLDEKGVREAKVRIQGRGQGQLGLHSKFWGTQ